MIRGVILLCALGLAVAPPAWSQQRKSAKPVTSARERALERLRALERAARPPVDTAAADSITGAGESAGAPAAPAGAAATDSLTRAAAAGALPGDTAAALPGDSAAAASGDSAILVRTDFPPDSMMLALRALEGYTVTEYQAERARFDADSGNLELIGEPVLTRQGQGMQADSLLRYDLDRSILCGYGHPVLDAAEGEPVESDQVCYDVDRRVGVAYGASTKFTENATWYVHGGELYTVGDDRAYGRAASFTSCDLEEPHYHFAAANMKIVHNDVLIARDVTLNFGDVPVFWLPFMVQSLKQGRRSGLLTPRFGINDIARRSGYRRQIENVGFFWAINDYLGTWAWMDWRSGDYTRLTGRLQFKWLRQFLNGSVDFSRAWLSDGRTTFQIGTNSNWQPGERTSVSVSGRYSSSTSFLRDHTFDPGNFQQDVSSTASLRHRFDWGSLSLGASRRQSLASGQVNTSLPSLNLSVSPITLFPAAGEGHWYNNATLSGGANFQSTRQTIDPEFADPRDRGRGQLQGGANAAFRIGGLSLSQRVDFNQSMLDARAAYADTVAVGEDSVAIEPVPAAPETLERDVNWSTALSYSQRLIGTSTFSPSVSVSGRFRKPDSLATMVASPARVSFGASLGGDIFGFWPGFGPFSRIRHRVSPSFSYSFSPALDPGSLTPLQREVFGAAGALEQNRLSVTVSQTFEAKYEASDTAMTDTASVAAPGEPRRLPQAKKITLLSLRTTAIAYDFVEARGRPWQDGFTTATLSHNIDSDLLKGLSLSLAHDLFRENDDGSRSFSLRLRRLNASFSLDGDSWLFQALGLGRAPPPDTATEAAADSTGLEDPFAGVPGAADPIASGSRDRRRAASGPVGSWRADIDYSLNRPPAGSNAPTDQRVGINLRYQPTEKWSLSWNTQYSITEGEFSAQSLTLTRDLHRWSANFSFYKAPTGNFMFLFHVDLLDNDDLKLDYRQQSDPLGPR
ncbi:MAG TPA: putative LPS assembly protein LptD [Longimicrobiales bacterium]